MCARQPLKGGRRKRERMDASVWASVGRIVVTKCQKSEMGELGREGI